MPRQGSLWVEFNYIHFIDSSEDEWRFLGDLVGTPSGARVGSIWLEGDYWHYIDSNGEERRMPGIFIYNHSAGFGDPGYTGARQGSIWLESTQHTDGTVHNDTPHGDLPLGNHSDASYGSPSHTDSPNAFHQDYPAYSQSHVDTTPSNAWTKPLLHYIEQDTDERGAHLDSTTNQGHGDHSDSSAWHINTAHSDHADNNLPNHGNTPAYSDHDDVHSNIVPMPSDHTNTAHGDEDGGGPGGSHSNHNDNGLPGHGNTPAYSDHDDVHGNSTTMGGVHTDSDTTPPLHVNVHSNIPSHTNTTPHTDDPHTNQSHGNNPVAYSDHDDVHGNIPSHTNTTPHTDDPHTNQSHGNNPVAYSDHTNSDLPPITHVNIPSHINTTPHLDVDHDDQSYAVPHEDDSHGDGHTDWPATV